MNIEIESSKSSPEDQGPSSSFQCLLNRECIPVKWLLGKPLNWLRFAFEFIARIVKSEEHIKEESIEETITLKRTVKHTSRKSG